MQVYILSLEMDTESFLTSHISRASSHVWLVASVLDSIEPDQCSILLLLGGLRRLEHIEVNLNKGSCCCRRKTTKMAGQYECDLSLVLGNKQPMVCFV